MLPTCLETHDLLVLFNSIGVITALTVLVGLLLRGKLVSEHIIDDIITRTVIEVLTELKRRQQ